MASFKAFLGSTLFILIVLTLLVFGATIAKAGDMVIDMQDFMSGDLAVDGFELKAKTALHIHAVGAESKYSDNMFAYGWILDAETREPVWVLEAEDTERFERSKILREYEDDISLPSGKYEAYYFVGNKYMIDGVSLNWDGLDGVIEIVGDIFDEDTGSRILDKDFYDHDDEEYEELKLQIEAPEGSFSKFDPVKTLEDKSFADLSKPDDDYYEKKGFTLKQDLTIKIIAIGEYSNSDRIFVDYCWIIDADTREKVWSMDRWNTSWAGGGRKNRAFMGEVELSAGNYLAIAATDGSHSFGAWNVASPYDPLHYGMVLYVLDPGDKQYISDFEDDFSQETLISLTRVRNGKFRQKGFKLTEAADLHIHAIGEYGYDDAFADYGWIEDYENEEIVWEMTEENTEHAGGAKKNRKFDGIVNLPAGIYAVYYVTDDSHAYRNWNSSPPIDKELWGVSISGVGKNFDDSKIEVFEDMPENKNIIVDLSGVGDHEDVREKFTLDKDTKIRIRALGEGSSGQMYDYGWIEDAKSGDIAWEMTYRKTRHAGGASKNRKVSQEILLEKGTYYAYFMTDGSHSFPDFNASAPINAHKWGMMITLAK